MGGYGTSIPPLFKTRKELLIPRCGYVAPQKCGDNFAQLSNIAVYSHSINLVTFTPKKYGKNPPEPSELPLTRGLLPAIFISMQRATVRCRGMAEDEVRHRVVLLNCSAGS